MTNGFPSKKTTFVRFFSFSLPSSKWQLKITGGKREGLWKFPLCGYKSEVIHFAKFAGPLVRNFPSVRFLDSTGLVRINRRLNQIYISNVFQFSAVGFYGKPKWRLSCPS
jgi:hypothetical protein